MRQIKKLVYRCEGGTMQYSPPHDNDSLTAPVHVFTSYNVIANLKNISNIINSFVVNDNQSFARSRSQQPKANRRFVPHLTLALILN